MYNRTRSYTKYDPSHTSWTRGDAYAYDNSDPIYCGFYGHNRQTLSYEETVFPLRYSTGFIQDNHTPRPKGIPYVRRSGKIPRAVKPVRHVKIALSTPTQEGDKLRKVPVWDDITISQHKTFTFGACVEDRTRTRTTNSMAWLCHRYGVDYVRNEILAKLVNRSDIVYTTPNWNEIMTKFNEQTNQLVPSAFIGGESLSESAIYGDALRLVLNPKKAILGFVKNVRKRGLHRLSLGELDLYYKKLFSKKTFLMSEEAIDTARDLDLVRFGVKEGINAHLSYKFGVVPAIKDVKETIGAHSNVESRLAYLNRHRGQYVPIRAKKGYDASFTPDSFTSPYLDFACLLRKSFTVGCIFGMGRIRTDINEETRYRAYVEHFGLNKIAGAAWELIPFSFVADWFTNSQELVEKLTRIPTGEAPFMNLTAMGSSYKNIALYDYICNPGYDLTDGFPTMEPNSQFPVFSYAVTEYVRSPKIPDTSGFVDLSNLGLFHALTGGELLLQKIL